MERITIRANTGGHVSYHQLTNELVVWVARLGYYVNVRPSAVSELHGATIPIEVSTRFVHRVQPEPWEVIPHSPEHTLTPGKKTVMFTMWESTRLRPEGFENLKKVEAVITPSHWNASCWSAAGIECPIFVVPLGVNPEVFNYAPMRMEGPCIFGTGGKLAQGKARKGLHEVMDVFCATFSKGEKVRLKVKCFTDCKVEKPDDPRIEVVPSFLAEQGMANFYKGLTCFVSASRGEGWGLMPHQAMACGRPVIGCIYGGMAEFMNSHNSYGLKFHHEKAAGFYEGCGTWSEPDLEDLQAQMRFVYEHREDALRKGLEAYFDVRPLTWENTARKTIEVLKKLGALES